MTQTLPPARPTRTPTVSIEPRRTLRRTVIAVLVLLAASLTLHAVVVTRAPAAIFDRLERDLDSGRRFADEALRTFSRDELHAALHACTVARERLARGGLTAGHLEPLFDRTKSAYEDGELSSQELRLLARELSRLASQ